MPRLRDNICWATVVVSERSALSNVELQRWRGGDELGRVVGLAPLIYGRADATRVDGAPAVGTLRACKPTQACGRSPLAALGATRRKVLLPPWRHSDRGAVVHPGQPGRRGSARLKPFQALAIGATVLIAACGACSQKLLPLDPPYKARLVVLGKEAHRYFLTPGGTVTEESVSTKCLDAPFSPKTPGLYWSVEGPGDASTIERELTAQLSQSGWVPQRTYGNVPGYRLFAWVRDFGHWSSAASVGIADGTYFVFLQADIVSNCPELGESPISDDWRGPSSLLE